MKTKSVSKFVCAALAVFARRTLVAAATFSTPFGDGMVLQRGRPVPVWGTAAPGERIEVRFAYASTYKRSNEPRRELRERRWSGHLYSTDSGLPLGPFEAEIR